MRIIAGSMGAAGSTQSNEPLGDTDKFETPQLDDAAWAQDVRRRELAMGIASGPARVSGAAQPAPVYSPPTEIRPVVPGEGYKPPMDISNLPDTFTLKVERKPDGWWKITTPDHHVGCYIIHKDLFVGLCDAPGSLAQLLRMDGPLPAPRKRKSK